MPDSTSSPSTIAPQPGSRVTIRCVGPYEIPAPSKDGDTLWLTPGETSDASEFVRIMNLSPTISQGLYSENVVFPFPAENALRFVEHHVERRKRCGINHTFMIRIGSPESSVPMIGLISFALHDHEDEGLCVRDPVTNSVENLKTHPLEPVVAAEDPTQDPEAIQACNEAKQRERAAAEGKKVLSCGGLGYWISDEHAGKGYMTRVVHYVLNHLHEEYGYDRVHAEGWEDNPGTLRVMAKAGMTYNTTRTIYVPKFQSDKQCAEYVWDAPVSS